MIDRWVGGRRGSRVFRGGDEFTVWGQSSASPEGEMLRILILVVAWRGTREDSPHESRTASLETLAFCGIFATMPATRSSSGPTTGLYRALASLQSPSSAQNSVGAGRTVKPKSVRSPS